ncbi:hypothetical protein [Streptomyces sp. NPDC006477]|uniref:hypothetical protein n=1 Tax=Streptomyces sp. NPDC006477 TaxID=3364747 RepID=UPI0036994337
MTTRLDDGRPSATERSGGRPAETEVPGGRRPGPAASGGHPAETEAPDSRPRGAAPPGAVRARTVRLLRPLAYVVLPAEVVLAVLLVGGVRIPGPVWAVAELLAVVLLLAEGVSYLRLRRRGLSRRAVVAELVPEPVLRIMGHELRIMISLARWVARRPQGVDGADAVFPHARDQAALMYGFAFVCLVETVGMSYLLADRPLVHAVVLVLDVYTVLFVLGLHAAAVTRPHTLTGNVLRLRQAAHVDVRVPVDLIASVRHELLFTHEKAEGELDLAVGSQTSVTIELSEPVDVPRLLGAPRPVRVLRVHADDPRALLDRLRRLTRERTAPSPPQGPPPSV